MTFYRLMGTVIAYENVASAAATQTAAVVTSYHNQILNHTPLHPLTNPPCCGHVQTTVWYSSV